MATSMNPDLLLTTPPEILGQTDIFGGEVTPPVISRRGDSPQDFAGHAPQDFGDAQIPHVTHEAWPPEGMTLVPAERITDAITGMTIVSIERHGNERRLHLQGVECPDITLGITDDGYWTAVVAS